MSFIITTSSNTGGIIIPNGDVEVIDGGMQTFQFLPDIGYTIDKLLIDGIEQEIVDSYTFENITSDHVIELIFEPLYYNITSSSINEGGTVYPLGDTNVQQGNSQTFNFFPNENYKVSKVLIDGIEVDNKSAYTFNNVVDNHTIDVEFEYVPRIFEINVMYTAGGKLNPEKTIKVIEGTNEVFDIVLDDKYELEYLSIDGDNVEIMNNQYVFENISDNHSIFAKFKYVPSYYVINASCNDGGKITNIGDHSYIEYSTIEYIFTPEHKHRVKNVIIDNISYGSIEKYTFSDLSSNHTIDVEFEYVPEVFIIQTSCGENGILSQAGEIKVNEATTFTLNIQPDYGYKIKEIIIDGQVVDNSNSISIENIWENHTIDVSFEPKIIYTITSSCDDNCKIYPLGQIDIYEEDNQKFEISANSGYFIKSIKVDDADIEFDILKTSYVFENLSDNHNIVVESEKIESQYFISSIASNHGNISPNGANSYEFGENVTYHFSPISGYKLNHVIVDGKKIKVSNNTYTFYNVRANHTITATFTPIVADVSANKINGLDLILNYDIYNRVEPSKIYLSKPKKHLLGVLNGVDEQSCKVTLKANNTFTLTFDVNRYIDGEESNYYNNIDILMELYVSSIGWFKVIQSPEINFDGNNEKLTITAESYEIELQQYDKVGFLVNKASEDSIEMMATDNTYLDENGYVLFRDNVLFHRDTSHMEALLDDFTSYDEEEQTIDNLKKLLVDNPFFITSAWRFDIDIDTFMSNIAEIKANLIANGYDTDYLDEFQELYNVKDSSTGESSLTTAIIKSYLVSNSELIEYIPFDINDQNISVKNKIFNCSSENSNGDLSAILNVENAYCVQGSEINFNVEVENNKGNLAYKYMFGEDEHCMTDYISQNSISWTSYYSINNEQYISIPITVEVIDTYIDDDNVKQTQTIKLTTYVYVFIDKDTLSEYLVENNIALSYEEYETYSLVELIQMEIQRMKDLSLLDQILLECPSWTVGFVDKYIDEDYPKFLCDEVGSFEIDSQDVYSLLTQTLAQYFSCIFVFDTINMTVNAYRVGGIGKDTNIHLGYRNIQNSVSVTPSEDLYTVFNVSNGDTLNLAYVNFGDREIEDISYFLTEEYLDLELIKKYKMWQEYRESLRDEYIEYSKLYNEQNNVITELYNRVPVDGLDIEQYKSFSYNELDEELHNYIALIEGIKSCFKIVDDKSQYETIVIVASEEHDITYKYDGLRENIEEIQKSIYWNEYKQYKKIVENILIAMNNFGMDEDDENYCDYIDDWQWDMITYGHMYGLDELKVKLEEFKNGLDVYKDYALPYEKTDKSIVELNYNAKRDEYLKYKTAYDKCIIMLNEREIEVSIAESILNEYYVKRNDIAQNVSKVNWSNEEFPNGFSDEDLENLGRLYKSTDYVNENIIYTSVSSTEDIVDKAYELYEDAIENLHANAHPRMTYSTSVDNLFTMVDYYDYIINDFSLYNFLRLSIRDDYQVKLRVVECSLNPMVYDNDLNIVFSNMVQYKSKRNDFASLLDNAISSAKNQISSLTKSSNSDANEFSFDYDMVKSLLNSKAFGNYMNSYRANSISPEALETALSRLDNISTNSAFIKYLNSNLLVTNDAYIDYLNSNLVVSDVADIRTLMFGSATGNVLQSNFSNSVISLLGDATIKSAMIESLNASKINAGTINTNYVEISSDSGNMKITDDTIQIKDDNDVTRVQIGKDATDDYNMYVLDENGKVMFDATGLHEDGIKNGIIRDDMVSDNANISGSKLNIQSLYSSMNDSGYSLNASNVKLDAENQSLEVSFNTLNSKVTQQGNSISSYGTKLSVLQGQIDSKIWKNDVETLVAESETLYNLNTQFSEFEQTLEGFETIVSRTNSRIDDLGGMRNLILDSDDVKISTSGTEEFIFETSIPIKPNSEYTFVLHGFANNSDLTNGGFALYFGNNLVEDKILCRTESETLVFTVTSPNVITDEYHVIFKNIPSETVLESKLEWICMYEGNASSVSNSWIPAPEDSAIMTTEAYSKATQTANDFSWLVSKNENTSEMTLSDEVLEIISKSVEINGTVSFGTFEDTTKAMLSSRIEANVNTILKLYTGDEIPTYTPSNLVLNAYSEYSDNRNPYSGRFKIEEYIGGGVWNTIQEVTNDATTSFEFNLNNYLNSSATQLRCSIYTDEEIPMLIDSITLDIADDFSAMLSVINNKTYVNGGSIYATDLYTICASIGGFNINEHSIYSGEKSSINNTSNGIYLGNSGQFYIGDDSNYIRYYKTEDGEYRLAISSKDIILGNGLPIEGAIEDAMNDLSIGASNLIVLNEMVTYVEYGGLLRDSTKGFSVDDDYVIYTNTKNDPIGFNIKVNDSTLTYSISGHTDLDSVVIHLACRDDYGSLGSYYQEPWFREVEVINGKFEFTFELEENTTNFNIGIGAPFNYEICDYYIKRLQVEKGNVFTDWSPSSSDVKGVILSGLDSIKNGEAIEITPSEVQTLTTTTITDNSSGITYTTFIDNNTNHYTLENGNLITTSTNDVYAGFKINVETGINNYILFGYVSNLLMCIYELDEYGTPINTENSPVFVPYNQTMLGGVTDDTFEHNFKISDDTKSFFIVFKKGDTSDLLIESIKLFKVTSDINTTLNISGNLNTPILNFVTNDGHGDLMSYVTQNGQCTVWHSTGGSSIEIVSTRSLLLEGSVGLTLKGQDISISGSTNVVGDLSVNNNKVLDASNYTTYCAKTSHTHAISDITNLQTTITNIQTTLNGKSNTHSHPYLSTSGGTLSGTLTITGATYPNGGIYLPNAKYIYANNTSGVSKSILGISGSNNIFLGYSEYSGVGNTNIYGNTIKLNAKTDVSISGYLSSQFNMGTDTASDGKRYYINDNATGRFDALRYTSSQAISSRRYKNNIDYKDADYWHEALMQIKPCSFYYKNDAETKHLGLIAEDLIELIPELVDTDEEGKPASIEYANLTIPLIGEVQRLNNVIDEQQKEIDSLKDELQQLKELVAKLVS